MIRDRVLDTEFAEPPIGEVHLHFTTDQSLRSELPELTGSLIMQTASRLV
jgi:hypothetical protein